jgi:two-component system, chemotaxis family, CheB/CheR fusion protein
LSKTKIKKNASKTITNQNFLVVGIGASAGGLEALKKLFENLPETTGLAFIVIQHLAENQESMLPEILARFTKMNVQQATEDMSVMPNHVYVVPPGKTMTFEDYKLKLQPRGKSLKPIDSFFISLAQNQKGNAIGIILSGTGTDGTQGLKFVNVEGGITFAQDPNTAQYPDMPNSAISTEIINFILSPENIAQEIVRISQHPENRLRFIEKKESPETKKNTSETLPIFTLLKTAFGVNFKNYKKSTTDRRINRRMIINKVNTQNEYVQFLKNNKTELNSLFEDLLINVTSFFRENKTFEMLKEEVFPEFVKNRMPNQLIRIWVPGCSTGEEVYSTAIALVEFLEANNNIDLKIQIFGTDINDKNIERARRGIYLKNIEEVISKNRINRFFVETNGNFQITKQIRDMCLFAKHDLTNNPPFSNLDLIVCRNLFIYFDSEIQDKLVPMFHYSLKPNGYLVLGESEGVGKFTNLFTPLRLKTPIYQKKQNIQTYDWQWGMSTSASVDKPIKTPITSDFMPEIEKKIDSILMTECVPASLVINSNLDVLAIRGKIDPYISIDSGIASLNASKIIRRELRQSLQVAVYKAKKDLKTIEETIIIRQDKKNKTVYIQIKPIKLPQVEDVFFLALFSETINSASKLKQASATIVQDHNIENQQFKELTASYESTKQTLQTIIEQKEAINEELQSAMEELQSSNEELMSTNEELETAKEELQSTNEELETVNDELRNRNQTLTILNSDLTNLMANVDSAIVILDNAFMIRRFNGLAEKLLRLNSNDTGKAITSFRLGIPIENLDTLLNKAKTLEVIREEIHTDSGKWYQMRIQPYLAQETSVIGFVISFVDISEIKLLEEKLMIVSSFTRHDIRNKLMILSANIFLAKKQLGDQPEIKKYLDPLTNVFTQIDKIFDFSKTYELIGRQKLEYVDLGIAFEQASLQFFSNFQGIKIINEVKGFEVLADSILPTIFGNLIDDTVKYGKKTTQIRIYTVKQLDNSVRLVYEDDGVGIKVEDRERLFEKGFTTGNSTGLGLYLVKKMVEVYGWTISEEGEPGKGVKFVIKIPNYKNEKAHA